MDDEVSDDAAFGEEGVRAMELRVRDTSLEPVFIGEGGKERQLASFMPKEKPLRGNERP